MSTIRYTQKETDLQRDHLGDGVYVAFRNQQVEISVNNHLNPPVVYLDRYSAKALQRYLIRVFGKHDD